MLDAFLKLIKYRITLLVLVSASICYFLGLKDFSHFSYLDLIYLNFGCMFLSSGTFALNQAQEYKKDILMPRTKNRPIPTGLISLKTAYVLSFIFILMGSILLYQNSETTFLLGLMTVIFYNVFYTLLWKPNWPFGAVPGAIPGALPAVIGYSASGSSVLSPQCLYLFFVLYLWQMPHFWYLAIKFKDDYAQGGFPVLPVKVGKANTIFYIALYTFAYTSFSLLAPLFFKLHWSYLVLVVVPCFFILFELYKFLKTQNNTRFFIWVNISLVLFFASPLIDRVLHMYGYSAK